MNTVKNEIILKYLFVLACIQLFSSTALLCQSREPVFQSLGADFANNSVKRILKDNKGYMWFGTSEGLIRYDGTNFYVYETEDGAGSLGHNSINDITEDKFKNLWIGTSNGLYLYDREKNNFINVNNIPGNKNALGDSYVSTLYAASNKLLWIGSFHGMSVYDPVNHEFRYFPHDPNDARTLSSNFVTCIAEDRENNIWIGTHQGLNLFLTKENKFVHFFNEPANSASLSHNNITSLKLDLKGNLWIGTLGGGLDKLVKGDRGFYFKRYVQGSSAKNLSSNFVLSLYDDAEGFLWIGTDNGGLNRLDIKSDSIRVFHAQEGSDEHISSNSVWSLYADDEGRVWIGTYNKGVNVTDPQFKKFDSYRKNSFSNKGLKDDDVRKFAEDDKGNIWIATDGGGLSKFDPVKRKFIEEDVTKMNMLLTNNAAMSLLIDSKQNFWVSTWLGGVDKFDSRGIKRKNYKLERPQGFGNNKVVNLYEDRRGNLWAGTSGSGLFRYDAKSDEFVESPGPTETSYITTIYEDSKNILWVGTLFGLVSMKINDDNDVTYSIFRRGENANGISSNSVEVIFEDSKGRLWFGTADNGLNLFNRQDSTFLVLKKNNGLPSNSIRGILEDSHGFLWLSTNKGISKFDVSSGIFKNFSKEDGLSTNAFYPRACLRTRRGEFYVGGKDGFSVFFPENIKSNTYIPLVYLTGLKINNKNAGIGEEKSPLLKSIGYTSDISLTHEQTSFSIDFVALNYTRPFRNQYSYKLEGFDKNWNFVGTQRSATYTNIDAGNYVFLVKGSNNDGRWNEIPARLNITILPPYWKTWWAMLSYFVLFSIVVSVFLKIRRDRINIRNELKLERIAREKEHELDQLKIQFFTNISHEFRTPLSLIIAPLESLMELAPLGIKDQLTIIHRNAERMMRLINNLMDFRKLDNGSLKLSVETGDLLQFVKGVSLYFREISKNRNIRFGIEAEVETISGWFDHDKLETILLNLFSNAFKFTNNHGEIRTLVSLKTFDQLPEKSRLPSDSLKDIRFLEIVVIDNGVGIPSRDMPYIFDKFYQAKPNTGRTISGTGIGLTLTKGLVELHHGTIWAESKPSDTRFTMYLPIDSYAYAENEIVVNPVAIPDYIAKSVEEAKIPDEVLPGTKDEEKPKILIVEDSDELRDYLASELGKKFVVFQAKDGQEGIDAALEQVPDLIVSDILMPNKTGIDLCKILKSDLRTSHIPIILLTAKTTVEDQIEGINTGADVYVTKPFNIQFLLAQVTQLIHSRRKLYSLFSQDAYLMPGKIANNEIDQNFLEKAIDYIIQNITDGSLKVENLADSFNLSRSQVYRKIKALTGQTAVEFIRTIRLKQALKLMETRKYSLTEIAYQSGFTSPSYFTKSFKDQYGKAPSEYLQDH